MKKLFSMILLAVVLFAACTHENDPVVKQIVTIQASIANDSRVALGDGEDEKKVSWTEGDKITLRISDVEYEFTWQEGTTFAYSGNGELPQLRRWTMIKATYGSTFSTTQTGEKDDVGKYMALHTVRESGTKKYEDLNIIFEHDTSVLKLTLSNDDFKSQEVKDIIVKAGTTVVAAATATFTGDAENGSVTAYFAIQPGTLENVTIHATCNGNTYTNSLANKTGDNPIDKGKLYTVSKELSYSHSYVDLGLPSGTKWATCNVGATSPEGYGDYFAWGEITAKADNYDYATYKYLETSYINSFTKYCTNAAFGYEGFTDDLTTLEPEDDAATANWGSFWRTPTSAEMQELKTNCTLTWTTQNGVNGCLVTSNIEGYTDKSIFLPAAGMKFSNGSTLDINVCGYYWSNSLNPEYLGYGEPTNADYLYVEDSFYRILHSSRNLGLSVRPVYVGN